ncbi:MAG: hypothetical protein D6696_05625 [Acidobacteria bacterium]|nr:MAG: hypothetical protein D6696_05625 [Acidobacteriota bacterium]
MNRLRAAGFVLLLAGIVVVALYLPARPPASWESARAFVRDDDACRALEGRRATAAFTAPAEPALTVAEVARRFDLELRLVCAANRLPEESCGGRELAAGEQLILPLSRRLPEEPAAVRVPEDRR